MNDFCIRRFVLISTISVFFVCCFVSCAVSPQTKTRQEKLFLLGQELHKWNTFKLTGICELEYQSFSLRRPCVISKDKEKFRFDVLDTGIFGLGGGVMMALYLDSEQVQFRRPGSSAIETSSMDGDIGLMLSMLSESLFQSMERHKDEIIDTNKSNIGGVDILFTHKMQIEEISQKAQEINVKFTYDKQDTLSEIKISAPLIRNLTIQIDKIEYNNIFVPALK